MRMVDVDTLERITRDIFVAWKAPATPRGSRPCSSARPARPIARRDPDSHYVHALKTGDVN
jgi:hypothetical protein